MDKIVTKRWGKEQKGLGRSSLGTLAQCGKRGELCVMRFQALRAVIREERRITNEERCRDFVRSVGRCWKCDSAHNSNQTEALVVVVTCLFALFFIYLFVMGIAIFGLVLVRITVFYLHL
jgi:hypothetical protein